MRVPDPTLLPRWARPILQDGVRLVALCHPRPLDAAEQARHAMWTAWLPADPEGRDWTIRFGIDGMPTDPGAWHELAEHRISAALCDLLHEVLADWHASPVIDLHRLEAHPSLDGLDRVLGLGGQWVRNAHLSRKVEALSNHERVAFLGRPEIVFSDLP